MANFERSCIDQQSIVFGRVGEIWTFTLRNRFDREQMPATPGANLSGNEIELDGRSWK